MSKEPKMQDYEKITETVNELRKLEKQVEEQQDKVRELQDLGIPLRKQLKTLGITCHEVTNCFDVGTKCYMCKNNQSRRSYFRDLLEKGIEVGMMYAANDASFFDSIKETE